MVDAVLAAAQDGHRLRDQAVLMRDVRTTATCSRSSSPPAHVPFVKFGGLKFLEAAHVKDFVAAVRLLDNRLDEVAWYRLLRLHDGIGPARARALLDCDRSRRPTEAPRPVTTEPIRHARGRRGAAAPAMCRVALAATLDGLAAARGRPADRRPGRGLPGAAPAAAHRPLPGLGRSGSATSTGWSAPPPSRRTWPRSSPS